MSGSPGYSDAIAYAWAIEVWRRHRLELMGSFAALGLRGEE